MHAQLHPLRNYIYVRICMCNFNVSYVVKDLSETSESPTATQNTTESKHMCYYVHKRYY